MSEAQSVAQAIALEPWGLVFYGVRRLDAAFTA